MALQPSNVGAAWTEDEAGDAASSDTVDAWFAGDAVNGFYPTSTDLPETAALLDVGGTGDFLLTDVSAGYPAYVARLYMVAVNAGGDFLIYE